jgi:hypothetical protein
MKADLRKKRMKKLSEVLRSVDGIDKKKEARLAAEKEAKER